MEEKKTTKKKTNNNEKTKNNNNVKERKNTKQKEVKVEEKNPVNKEKKNKKKIDWKAKASKINDNWKLIISFCIGLAIGILILIIVYPDRIATLKDGTQPVATVNGKNITADDLYNDMKDYYSISKLLDSIDNIILEKKYPEDDEMNDEVKETAESYISYYEENYNYTEEQFLSSNGFDSYDDFLDYLKLDYRRNLYYDSYLEKQIDDDDINDYYKNEVFGDINCQHLLVEVDDETDSDAAEEKAKEIIKKLDDGESWDDVVKEYKDDITFEDLGYQAFNADLEDSFMEELKSLEENSYSKEPVETSYGFHVVYRLDQKDKAKLKDIKDDIIEELKDKLADEDENIYYKALINMREEANVEFVDSDLKKKYDDYKKEYE